MLYPSWASQIRFRDAEFRLLFPWDTTVTVPEFWNPFAEAGRLDWIKVALGEVPLLNELRCVEFILLKGSWMCLRHWMLSLEGNDSLTNWECLFVFNYLSQITDICILKMRFLSFERRYQQTLWWNYSLGSIDAKSGVSKKNIKNWRKDGRKTKISTSL